MRNVICIRLNKNIIIMSNKPDFDILKDLTSFPNQKNLDLIVQALLNEIQIYIGLEPIIKKFKVVIRKKEIQESVDSKEIFRLGVNRYFQNNMLIVEVFDEYKNFLPIILLREIYNFFIPIEVNSFELIQLVINQIIIKKYWPLSMAR